MATMITSECINCGACEPECPNNAISQGEEIYLIDPQLCTECVGFHDYEACAAVCPVDCCVTDPNNVEAEEALIARARDLHKDVDFGPTYASRFHKAEGDTAPAAQTTTAEQAPQSGVTAPAATEAKPAPVHQKLAAEQPPQSQTVTPAGPEPKKPESVETAQPAASAPPEPSAQAPAEVKAVAPPSKPAPKEPPAQRAQAAAPSPPRAMVEPKPPVVATAAQAPAPQKPEKKRFPGEMPAGFNEIRVQLKEGGPLKGTLPRIVLFVLQPLLGALPHADKQNLERGVGSFYWFSAAGATALNILLNIILYPLLLMGIATALSGTSILFSQKINLYILAGIVLGFIEGAYRLRDGIIHVKPAEDMVYPAAIYGVLLSYILGPVLRRRAGLLRSMAIPVDGFYGKGFVEKLERERRYGNVYTIEDWGEAYFVRVEFPRRIPDIGLAAAGNLPREMPDYDYDLMLKNGNFIVKGRCPDERIRKISSSVGAFPPEFTTVIPLGEKVEGFAHRVENKALEVLLPKQKKSKAEGTDHR